MNYLGANMKLIVECSQKLVRLGENLWGKEQKLGKAEPLDVPTMTTEFIKENGGLPCPDGYIFKDENDNVINATKIVLEKLVVPKFKKGDKIKDKNNRVWYVVQVGNKHFDISHIPDGSGYFVPMEDQDDYELVPQCFSNKTDDIIKWLRERDMTKYIGVLYSGMFSITFDTEKLIKDITEMIGDE